jgi:hypothetical protein
MASSPITFNGPPEMCTTLLLATTWGPDLHKSKWRSLKAKQGVFVKGEDPFGRKEA